MARRTRKHPAADLFGEIPVTWPEVWAWVEKATGLKPDSWRARYYVTNWNVVDKIRQAKMRKATSV
jgi:hypothetical protein